jgi:D-glucuronyl C5-epimerase C-terminus
VGVNLQPTAPPQPFAILLVVTPMRRINRSVLAALAVTLVAAVPASAAQVTLVRGDRAVRVNDPFVPSKAEVALGPPGAAVATAARADTGARAAAGVRVDRRAVFRALRGTPDKDAARRWRRWYVSSLNTYRRLAGARRQQLGYVIDSVEALALGGRLRRTRMPAAFVQLERNRRYWRSLPYPAVGDQVSFRGSEILYQYFPGQGLQLHPLSTFKKANLMYGACMRGEPACDENGLRRLLDEMEALAVRRSRRFIAWEYAFSFGGGSPPWMSGMAQATGIQALARAAKLLNEPHYVEVARKALGAFETLPPTGVRTTGPAGGVHYLQYSFSPRLYIFNAFLQALIGLHDFGKLAGNARATKLFREGEPEAREEVPLSDVGDWSRYSYRGAESNRDYHELLREFLESMCIRRLGEVYCDYAARYRGYQVDPPELVYSGPRVATEDQLIALRFTISKLSVVEVKVFRSGKLVFSRLATVRRGIGAFAWRPRGPGAFRVQLAAKELRTGLGKRDRDSAEIQVEDVPGQ